MIWLAIFVINFFCLTSGTEDKRKFLNEFFLSQIHCNINYLWSINYKNWPYVQFHSYYEKKKLPLRSLKYILLENLNLTNIRISPGALKRGSRSTKHTRQQEEKSEIFILIRTRIIREGWLRISPFSLSAVITNSRDKRFIMQLTVINRGESDGAEQPCSHADGGHLRFPRCKFHLT